MPRWARHASLERQQPSLPKISQTLTQTARYAMLSSSYNEMAYYASHLDAEFDEAREIAFHMTCRMKKHWEMINNISNNGGEMGNGGNTDGAEENIAPKLFGVRDPIVVNTKGNPGGSSSRGVPPKARKCGHCRCIGHTKRTCKKFVGSKQKDGSENDMQEATNVEFTSSYSDDSHGKPGASSSRGVPPKARTCGRCKTIQLEYTDAKESLLQPARKAPVAALGFRVQCNKWAVIVRLLLGEIPERTVFMQKGMEKALRPYFELTNAVRVGDLKLFKAVVEKLSTTFCTDGTQNLIVRLRHIVIRTGIRNISISYSHISLTDVAKKLRLDSENPVVDAESIVAKAIRYGAIDATLDRASGCHTGSTLRMSLKLLSTLGLLSASICITKLCVLFDFLQTPTRRKKALRSGGRGNNKSKSLQSI
ncbi:hypothetical protein Vadar_028264 [Vaccinium darrowii]|uniref:Uncharacterized protein n=1 Tax=Vaccinium darrowii TaxID=229202 RepID=A0ACB7ZN66_9ERIC|nr:hypothetical protein Vadar_028264 [Vaccinium darrowii]